MGISAAYFDGKTSRRFAVEFSVAAGTAFVTGDIQRNCPIDELRVSERVRNAARKVTFLDGAYLEVSDNSSFNQLLAETGYQDSLVVAVQQSWRGTFIACIATMTILVFGYLYGLPAASEAIAKALPEQAERVIGRETLDFLDQRILAPSKLPEARRKEIVARFKGLVPPRQGVPAYEIIFRKSKIGPNAFALPSGQIILTDEIVQLVQSDDAVIGILAHELAHLHERHLMRRVIQSSVIGAAAMALSGDVSSIVAGIPTIMLDLKYSRDAEREADDYAIAMLKANGIDLSNLTLLFEKIGEDSEGSSYLSSHPPASERVERILKER
ncbi:MAG: Zn-dependent protease [Burkholderiales bacterium RIFCSPLOWO2_02_FULL_57_36]|nr:MAG: Zn-dependent protease [Burkholderiales bacterium RIFCSPLOWO2_02_FULL_57_36]